MKSIKQSWLVTTLLLVLSLLVPIGAWAQTQPVDGDGSADSPFEISSYEELKWFRDYVNGTGGEVHAGACATLMADITMSEADNWTPIGNTNVRYRGTFDGNGKTIKNLYINSTSQYTGFFGYATTGGCIKNITFDKANVTSTDYYTGILVGDAGSCTIQGVKTSSTCSVKGQGSTGGIAGDAKGDIINCENRATVSGSKVVGGIAGYYSSSSITSCANYGEVTGTANSVGGIVGYFSSGTIQDSANYGNIQGEYNVGNLIGFADKCNLKNVLGTGNVSATKNGTERIGILVGYVNDSSSTAQGLLAYNSNATVTIAGTVQTGDAVKAIGGGTLSGTDKIKAFTAEQLRSGLVTYLLQQNATDNAVWGQRLNTDNYPVLGSTDKVYLDDDLTLKCTGVREGTGTFSNTQPAQEGTLTMQHGTATYHAAVATTCTTDGNKEYWECSDCHATFSDEGLTTELTSTVEAATGHSYDENDKCTKCQQEIPFVKLGNNTITIEKAFGSRNEISGYSLYKYTAKEDGTLEVTAVSGNDTYGTLWSSRSAETYLKKDDSGNSPDFKLTYEVTKGTTYYIGARHYDGYAIEGGVTLNIKMNGLDVELPEGMTGKGTEAEPFILKTAEHLAWFRGYVNDNRPSICAKIADDVEEIDMSSVCHQANDAENVAELSWTPIGNTNVRYKGTFDGNGKTIKNLYINSTSQYTGFFGYATTGGCIKNITFDKANVTSTDYYTGILVGDAGSCTIQGVKTSSTCSVKGQGSTGGIAGDAKGDIINCENRATVSGSKVVGGIAGYYSSSSITSCANYGEVTGTANSVGGIVGYFSSGTIQDSANYGNIQGEYNVGNLIGFADKCNLKNVLGTGNVSATKNGTERIGILVGYVNDSSSTAQGLLAYNSNATVTIAGTVQTGDAVKAIGGGTLTFADGKTEADVIKAFTTELLQSGEVAYLLNGEKSEGALAWYQELGTDAYPVLTVAEGNTVYKGNFTYCDGTTTTYSNSASDGIIHLKSATLTSPEFDADQHIYHMGCRNEICPLHKYVVDANGTIEATKDADDKFYIEELNLTDASIAINTETQFTIKNLSYSRALNEGQKGYVTLCLPFDINTSDVTGAEKCYSLGDMMIHMKANDGETINYILMLDDPSTITAGTPMVVKLSEEGEAQSLVAKAQNVEYSAGFFTNPSAKSLTLRDWDGKSGMMPVCHDLEGAAIGGVYTTTAMQNGSYSLRADGKFGSHTGDLSPYRVYLNITGSQTTPSRAMTFSIGMRDDDTVTGIRIIGTADGELSGSTVQSSAIYTLGGQRVTGTHGKGIYIKNGKKYIVK